MRPRKAEMSMQMVVVIVICLIILSISAYFIYSKSKQATAAGKCEALGGRCIDKDTLQNGCPDDKPRRSLTSCKTEGAEPKDGYCCYPE